MEQQGAHAGVGGPHPRPYVAHPAEPGPGADCQKRPLLRRSRFQWQVKRNVFSRKEGVLVVIKDCLTKRRDTVGQP